MEVTEPPVETAQSTGQQRRTPHFNKENAKAYAVQATEARKQAAIARQKAIDAAKVVTELAPSEVYRLNRLALVRSQLGAIDSELSELIKSPKHDQSRSKWLLEAQDRLSEQERKLDGRPLPGSHRPRTPSTKRSTEQFTPEE